MRYFDLFLTLQIDTMRVVAGAAGTDFFFFPGKK
jgi:hypothetical protein